MGVSLKFSLLGFEVELTDFTNIVSDFVGVHLDPASKSALQTLLSEARRSFDVVVDVITPLYVLDTPASLQAQFSVLQAGFKNAYFKNGDAIRTHCHVVSDQIERLKAGQAWKRNVPGLRQAFDRLVASQVKWVGNDNALADTMNRFLEAMNTGLETIAVELRSDPVKAQAVLHELLDGTDGAIKSIRTQLNQLTILSQKL